MTLNIGIVLALACAVATQLGFLYKHRGANAAPKVDIRHPLRSVRSLFASRWFAIGMGVALGAWLLHVAALAFAPLSVVQAVLSTGVVILAVMADRLFGFEVGRRQWLGVAMTAVGLILLVVTLPTHSGAHSSYSLAGMLTFEGGMLVIGALLITGPRMGAPDHHHGIMLGAAAGVLFGVSDVAIKALTGLGGPLEILLSPWLAFTVLASIVAFYASARGLQDGEAVPVIASTSTAANVSCILGGIVVFGDPMPSDTLGIAIQALAFTLVVVAALVTPPPLRAAEANAQPAEDVARNRHIRVMRCGVSRATLRGCHEFVPRRQVSWVTPLAGRPDRRDRRSPARRDHDRPARACGARELGPSPGERRTAACIAGTRACTRSGSRGSPSKASGWPRSWRAAQALMLASLMPQFI